MTRTTRQFSDVDLTFKPHPVTNDLSRKLDLNSIKTSVKNLLLTNKYERPFKSDIGTNLRSLLFELATPLIGPVAKRMVAEVLEKYEPRVELLATNVFVSEDTNSMTVEVIYRVRDSEVQDMTTVAIQRTN